jgi:hypothetical protein
MVKRLLKSSLFFALFATDSNYILNRICFNYTCISKATIETQRTIFTLVKTYKISKNYGSIIKA